MNWANRESDMRRDRNRVIEFEALRRRMIRLRASGGYTLRGFGAAVGLPWRSVEGYLQGRTTPSSAAMLVLTRWCDAEEAQEDVA
jgi:hypothetical protein